MVSLHASCPKPDFSDNQVNCEVPKLAGGQISRSPEMPFLGDIKKNTYFTNYELKVLTEALVPRAFPFFVSYETELCVCWVHIYTLWVCAAGWGLIIDLPDP